MPALAETIRAMKTAHSTPGAAAPAVPDAAEPAGAGFAQSLLDETARAPYRFCTPSLLPEVATQISRGLPETSVSLTALGSHLSGHGPLGAIAERAADLRGADRAFISFAGTTFSNQVILAYLAATRPGRAVLIAANVHHSIIGAARRFGIPFAFIGGQHILARFEAVLPPGPADVAAALRRHPDAAAVIITSPSYEGITADITTIASTVHAHADTLLVVDQAWGAHLGASPLTADSAITCGADLAGESTHKLGGAPNQLGLLLARGPRIDHDALTHAYSDLTTTSPNFPLAAHLDTALTTLHSPTGRTHLDTAAATARAIAARLDHHRHHSVLVPNTPGAPPGDPLKLTITLHDTALTGFALARTLANQGIIVEKAGLASIVLIATYTLPPDAEHRIVKAITQAITAVADQAPLTHPALPLDQLPLDPAPTNTTPEPAETIPLHEAAGTTAARLVECYPPGIGLLIPGFTITPTAINYLTAAHTAGAEINGTHHHHNQLHITTTPAHQTTH